MGDKFIESLFYIALIIVIGTAAMFIRVSAPDNLGCKAAIDLSGFQSCKVKDHKIWWVSLDGCSDSDGHAYIIEGINSNGRQVEALVCCGSILKSCTIRMR